MTRDVLEGAGDGDRERRPLRLTTLRRARPGAVGLVVGVVLGALIASAWSARLRRSEISPGSRLELAQSGIVTDEGIPELAMTFVNFGAKPFRLTSVAVDDGTQRDRRVLQPWSTLTVRPALSCPVAVVSPTDEIGQVRIRFVDDAGVAWDFGYSPAPAEWKQLCPSSQS